MTPATLDDNDLKLATTELLAAREMLKSAHEITERRERREAIMVAVGRLALASRAINLVLDRRTGKEPTA